MQDEISQLDESIQEYQDSDEENVIESSVSGRVKKINVSAGSDLSDIMVSDGALMCFRWMEKWQFLSAEYPGYLQEIL